MPTGRPAPPPARAPPSLAVLQSPPLWPCAHACVAWPAAHREWFEQYYSRPDGSTGSTGGGFGSSSSGSSSWGGGGGASTGEHFTRAWWQRYERAAGAGAASGGPEQRRAPDQWAGMARWPPRSPELLRQLQVRVHCLMALLLSLLPPWLACLPYRGHHSCLCNTCAPCAPCLGHAALAMWIASKCTYLWFSYDLRSMRTTASPPISARPPACRPTCRAAPGPRPAARRAAGRGLRQGRLPPLRQGLPPGRCPPRRLGLRGGQGRLGGTIQGGARGLPGVAADGGGAGGSSGRRKSRGGGLAGVIELCDEWGRGQG